MGLFRTAAPREEKHEPEVTVRLAEESMEEVSSRMVLPQDAFMSMLYLERRRAERSQKRYVLLLVELNDAVADKQKIRTVQKVTRTLCSVTRETDVLGWYVPERIIGIIATEIGKATSAEVRQRMTQKFRAAFSEALGASKAEQITVSFHFFPEDPESSYPPQRKSRLHPAAIDTLNAKGTDTVSFIYRLLQHAVHRALG